MNGKHLVILAFGAALGIVGGFSLGVKVLSAQINKYARSDEFRTYLEEKTTEFMHELWEK